MSRKTNKPLILIPFPNLYSKKEQENEFETEQKKSNTKTSKLQSNLLKLMYF